MYFEPVRDFSQVRCSKIPQNQLLLAWPQLVFQLLSVPFNKPGIIIWVSNIQAEHFNILCFFKGDMTLCITLSKIITCAWRTALIVVFNNLVASSVFAQITAEVEHDFHGFSFFTIFYIVLPLLSFPLKCT